MCAAVKLSVCSFEVSASFRSYFSDNLEQTMTLLRDVYAIADADYEQISQSLKNIEHRIFRAGTNIDSWALAQSGELRTAAEEIRRSLDEIHHLQTTSEDNTNFAMLRAELLNIDDLRRAVSAFDQYVSKWVSRN